MIRSLAAQCASIVAERVGFFAEFHVQPMSERGLEPANGVMAAAEYFDGEEVISCVFACAEQSSLIPIFMGVPPLGDIDAVFAAVLRGSLLGSPSMAAHHTLQLIGSRFFESEGIAGAALLPAATLGYLGKLPRPWFADDGVSREFLLPVFLDEAEYTLARTDMAELMDELDRRARDLMSVRRRFC